MRSPLPLMLVVGLGVSLQPLDTSVNVAFPAITEAFGIELRSIQWVAVAYVLTYAAMLLVCGRLGDLFGYRRVFRLGLATSAVGLALCALAETYLWLLAFRILQGVGTALVMSCGPALATALYPPEQRARALSHYGVLFAAGMALGPVAGGFMVDWLGWQGVYWFRVPVAILALIASYALPGVGGNSSVSNRFDAIGAVLLAFWMSAILLGLALLQVPEVDTVLTGLLVIVGVAALAAFIARERKLPSPIIRLSLFAERRFAAINLLNVVVFLVGFAAILLTPYYLTRQLGLDVRLMGLVMTLWAAGSMLGAWAAGKLVARALSQAALAFCCGWILVLGLALAALCGPDTGLVLIGAALFVQGLALGGFQLAYTDTVVAALREDERGVAGSLAMLTRTLGTVGGATVLAASFAALEGAALSGGQPPDAAFMTGFVQVFAGSAAALAVTLLAAMAVSRTAR
ncbi:MAG: MFS transporter [Reyranellaceae bacterium]